MTERERFEAWAARQGFLMDAYNDGFVDPSTRFAWEAWQAACPNGWRLVPMEPSQYQQNAGSVARYHHESDCRGIYRAMLAAAPQPGEE